jgi:endonuclease/exonuclease/phosphatase family metal-dependent hydrolase
MWGLPLLTRRCRTALLALGCTLLPILNAYADIVVASWNIQRLGHGGQKSYPALAAIASKIDLLAVQEVMTEEGIEKLERQPEQHTGES